LLKTFWGWRDEQHPDGVVVWTSPDGQTYTTHPGSRVLFPALCRPTAPAIIRDTPDSDAGPQRTLAMPRRKATRAQSRAQAINDERAHNQPFVDAEVAERNKPPPF
jgi:hypothetical protein